ncbi:hypothetical protein [Halomonas mongoliensis]|uniref:hypothetical protein n=1 Tax=Halomonas mongoliensis TaxID=321265 RepID=UPI00403B2B27
MNLTATSSFPEDLAGTLTVLVNYQNEAGDEQYLGGARYAAGDIVPVDQHGRESSTGAPDVVGGNTTSAQAGNAFSLEKAGERMTMLLETNFDAEGGRLEARVIYMSISGSVRPDRYFMELSR